MRETLKLRRSSGTSSVQFWFIIESASQIRPVTLFFFFFLLSSISFFQRLIWKERRNWDVHTLRWSSAALHIFAKFHGQIIFDILSYKTPLECKAFLLLSSSFHALLLQLLVLLILLLLINHLKNKREIKRLVLLRFFFFNLLSGFRNKIDQSVIVLKIYKLGGDKMLFPHTDRCICYNFSALQFLFSGC